MSQPEKPFCPDDLVTGAVVADPYPAYRALREQSPLRYLYIPDGSVPGCPDGMQAWAVMSYRDVRGILRDHQTFSSKRPLAGRLMPRLVLLQDDPPRHSWFRGLVRKAFAPTAIARLDPEIERLAKDLLDRFEEPEVELVSAFAAPLPISVVAGLLGIPEEDHRIFRRWSDRALSVLSVSREEKSQDREEVEAFFKSEIVKRTRKSDRGNLIDILVSGKINGVPLQEWEIVGFCILLLIAGSETTTNLIGNMLNLLAHRPDLWDRLRRDRNLVAPFIEEALRYESPLQRLTRVATRDIEISGVRIASGDIVVAFIGAANRDQTMFENPDEFQLHRPRSDSLAFGSGIHHCLGAGLARTEARVVLNAILDRFSCLEPGVRKARRQSSKLLVLGFESLPLRLTR